MAPQSKKTNPAKGKGLRKTNTGRNEPELEQLRAELEKRVTEKEVQAKSGENTPNSSQSHVSVVLTNPEALSQDLVQEMRAALGEMRRERKQQQEKIIQLTSQCTAVEKSEIQWKKEEKKKSNMKCSSPSANRTKCQEKITRPEITKWERHSKIQSTKP